MAKAPIEIRSLARSHTERALNTLTDIMNNDRAPLQCRISAAQYILDRGWGKAPQSLEITGDVKHSVIRAPAIAASTQEWTETHAPQQTIN